MRSFKNLRKKQQATPKDTNMNSLACSETEETIDTPPSSGAAEKGLAAGILKQAARDVRRFRGATTAVEEELYRDAYSWIMANDFSWPFSFLNVCKSLGRVPDDLRNELLVNPSLGWLDYCRKLGSRLTRALQSPYAFIGRR